MISVVALLFTHWVADFLFQTETMALGKSNSIKWLSFHVLVYSAVILIFACFMFNWQTALVFVAVNGGLHWLTDFITSKLTTAYYSNRRKFFLIIGLDQFIHSATLLLTFDYAIRSATHQ